MSIVPSDEESTLVTYSMAASNEIIRQISTSGDREARQLALSLVSIHTEIMGMDAREIRELFKRYKQNAVRLFSDKPEWQDAISDLIRMASMIAIKLNKEDRELDIQEMRARAELIQAEQPIRIIQEERRTLMMEGGISGLLSAGVAWLGKDLVNQGLNLGRGISRVISDPYHYCTTESLVEEKTVGGRLLSYLPFVDTAPTLKTVRSRESGMICDALYTISGGLDSVVEAASTSNTLASLIVFIILFTFLLTLLRMLRVRRLSIGPLSFSGQRHSMHDDDLMEELTEMVRARLRSPVRHRSSIRKSKSRSPIRHRSPVHRIHRSLSRKSPVHRWK